MSQSLLSVLRTKWDDDVTLVGIAGRLYANEIPERDTAGNLITYPLSYVELSKTRLDWTMYGQNNSGNNKVFFETNTVYFTTLTNGAKRAEDVRDRVRFVFDWKDLGFTEANVYTVKFEPIDFYIEADTMRHKDGSLLYRTCLSYHAVIQRLETNQ